MLNTRRKNSKKPLRGLDPATIRLYELAYNLPPNPERIRQQAIQYRDDSPTPIKPVIPLVEYFERVKRHKADRWQQDFCDRLQRAAEERHIRATMAVVHAEAQIGKSVILAQCYPAWLLGHDPLLRIALATYNITRSQAHSWAVIQIMNLDVHKAIFQDTAGHVPVNASREKWVTAARKTLADAQASFNPVGLQSGLTGSGFDCLPAETRIRSESGLITVGELYAMNADARPLVMAVELEEPDYATPKYRRILAMTETFTTELVEIETVSRQVLRCTANHRIYVNGEYRTADTIQPGQSLVRVHSRQQWSMPPRITHDSVFRVERVQTESIPVYDLQVEGFSNFFAEEILVHNCLIIDDPYADQKEAFSETARRNLEQFWEMTVMSRKTPNTNVFGMFHRYHYQDLAGYLLDSGDFDYWRYASIADGDFINKTTGRVYPDPLGRGVGELISPERRPESYYVAARVNTRVWNSMFLGRPAPESGDFFHVEKIAMITDPAEVERRAMECVAMVRAWDNAAVESGGDWTVGVKMAVDPAKRVIILDAVKGQYATDTRLQMQKRAAMGDGSSTVITIPRDPASAGKDVVFFTQRELEGFTVVERPTTGKKAVRALPLADAIREGRVSMAAGDWNEWVLSAFREFGFTDFDHPVDAAADGFNWLMEQSGRGLICADFNPVRHVIRRIDFFREYGNRLSEFNLYAGISIRADGSLPNSGVIVAIPPEIEGLGQAMVVLAEYSKAGVSEAELFEWLHAGMSAFGGNGNGGAPHGGRYIVMDGESEAFRQVIWQKLQLSIAISPLRDDEGIAELIWYFRQGRDAANARTGELNKAARFFITGDENEFPAFYREAASWGYDVKGMAGKDAHVMRCLAMLAANFHAGGPGLTEFQKIEQGLPEVLRKEHLENLRENGKIDAEYDSLLRARLNAVEAAKQERQRADGATVYGRPVFGSRFNNRRR